MKQHLPLLEFGDDTLNATCKIANLLGCTCSQPRLTLPTPSPLAPAPVHLTTLQQAQPFVPVPPVPLSPVPPSDPLFIHASKETPSHHPSVPAPRMTITSVPPVIPTVVPRVSQTPPPNAPFLISQEEADYDSSDDEESDDEEDTHVWHDKPPVR